MKNMLDILILTVIMCGIVGCSDEEKNAISDSGVTKASAEVETQASGLTIEQENIKKRLEEDNKPGSIKHLYIVSAYSGDVIIYSTVKGKVTSGGKRLTSTSRAYAGDWCRIYSPEVIQDDGTYGRSIDYLYWWDTKGIYHQHYVLGGQIIHISAEPLAVKKIIINMELMENGG